MTNGADLRVLLVDDDPDDALLVRQHLAAAGIGGAAELEHVSSARAALERIERNGFDLLLLDYRIGPDDGVALLRQLRANGIDTPAILLTGQGGEEIAVEAMKAGAVDYLSKARLAPASLGAAIRYAVELHRSRTLQAAAEAALQQSEAHYRAVFEQAVTGNFVTTPSGRIVACNAAFARMFGFDSVEQALAERAYSLYPDAAARDAFLCLMRSHDTLEHHEVELRRRDGTTLHVIENVVAIRNATGALVEFQGSFLDVTERKQAEEELRASEERYRDLVEHMQEPICTHDLDGRILSINPRAAEILGCPPEALLAMNLRDILSPDVRLEFEDYLVRIQRAGVANGVMLVRTAAGEQRFWEYRNSLRTEGVPAPLVRGIARDVTERRRAERALRASEEHFRLLFEQATDGIFVTDAEGRVRDVNPAGCGMTGYSREELLRMRVADLVAPEEVERIAADVARLERAEVVRNEWSSRRKDGSTFLGETTARKLRGELYRTCFRDLTEQRRLEQQLLQSQKQEVVGRLAGGIAHDLNNLIGVVMGWGGLLLEGAAPEDPIREPLREIVKAAERTSGLAGQLLAVGRAQVLSPQVLNLNALVSEMETMLRPLIGEHIDFQTVLAADLGCVKADPSQIEQVLLNLVVNAGDAMPAGGRLTIETSNVGPGDASMGEHPEVAPGAYVRLAVTDSGEGIDPTVRARIFEPYFTTKENGKGTGLGLSIVFGIVEQNRGHIFVESEPGQGTTFEVYFPLVGPAS